MIFIFNEIKGQYLTHIHYYIPNDAKTTDNLSPVTHYRNILLFQVPSLALSAFNGERHIDDAHDAIDAVYHVAYVY
jgi:hypothetical protein